LKRGWEYDPDAESFRTGAILAVKNHVTAADFGVMKLFNTEKQFKGWLSDSMRALFRKPPNKRTDLDIIELQNWCSGMKGFSKYPPNVQVNND
jgi:hypothetical protein